uniref:Dynein regulatory complex protein 10 n=1 Tax=Hemiselmis tepida TaxID=464990 RepID=A0A7S0VDH4_9CRYP|mmetsp:Transcript_15260/g.38810  ORF Transcript_15260/g.38810 Transcript_15260/m.38810 type:complete len:388 (+) Transcript_15260:213-1376(+)
MNGNYQLTNVEAQRVMAVLDELALDLRLAFRLTPQTLSTNPDIASIVGQENERFFVMQVELEKRFFVLAAQLEGPVSEFVADAENDTQDAVVHDFFDVARRLRKNTREICRFLRRNPGLDKKLQAQQQQPAELAERFIVVLNDLKAQTLRSLGTSVEEDKSEKEHFENVSVREKTLTEQERMLTKDLATVKRDREKAVKARDAQIATLEAEKAELQMMTANAGKAVGEGNNANEKTDHASEVESLEKKKKKLEDELAKTKASDKDSEEGLKKRSYKKETDVETWVQKYDAEMGTLNEEMTSLAEVYLAEKAKMRQLENHFEGFRLVEGAEAAQQMMQMANELEETAKQKRLGDAACLIQSTLRGHKGRENFQKSKKKGGKKGGKKKK